jgi:cytochrome c5
MENLMGLRGTVLIWIVSLMGAPLAANAGEDGRRIFTEYKCNQCHTVQSQGIKLIKPKDKPAPDLSKVGGKHSDSVLTGYLLKSEKLNNKKHRKKFTGEDEELSALVKWLQSLK